MAVSNQIDGKEKSRHVTASPKAEDAGLSSPEKDEKEALALDNPENVGLSATGSSTPGSDDLEDNPVELSRTVSNPPPVFVPRRRRRGLFAQLAVLPEVEEPRHYPRKTKWLVTFVIAIAGMAAPMGSAIFFRMFS